MNDLVIPISTSFAKHGLNVQLSKAMHSSGVAERSRIVKPTWTSASWFASASASMLFGFDSMMRNCSLGIALASATHIPIPIRVIIHMNNLKIVAEDRCNNFS